MIRFASLTDRGARQDNEDALVHGESRSGHYAVLADGAGGHQRGAEAAQRSVECIERILRDDPVGFSPANLSQIVRLAHWELQHHQHSDDRDARMHCTIVVLWVEPGAQHVLWTHVGDSRLYRIRHGRTDFVTSDDSVVQRLVQTGVIGADQSKRHPHKNELLAALGIAGEVDPHTVVRPVELHEGDAFLLCTDGWWEAFDEAAIAAALGRALTPEDWLADMRARIVACGKPRQDNYSAIAVWVGDPAEVTHPGADDTMPRPRPAA